MAPAIAATTVNASQINAMTENGIMAFTVTSFPSFSYAASGVLAAAGTECDGTPRGVLRFRNMRRPAEMRSGRNITDPPQRADLLW
jgi:hypothetical protein